MSQAPVIGLDLSPSRHRDEAVLREPGGVHRIHFTPKGPPELFCRERPTGKPLSQTCVASENGFEAKLVFDEAITTPQRAFERRVDRQMTLRGWQSARFTLTPIRPRPCAVPVRGLRRCPRRSVLVGTGLEAPGPA